MHPYESLPEHAFWRRSIAEVDAGDVDPVVRAKFTIGRHDRVATAGSCFAQHIARALSANGFNFFVTEAAHPIVRADDAARFNYGVYTARYGNVYTSRQFLQLLRRAYGLFGPKDDAWNLASGAVIDPYRPQIQPDGFASVQEMRADREQHFAAIRRAVEELDVFVYTLGLTESWVNREDGAAYPLCPGVAGGAFDQDLHAFVNLTLADVTSDMRAAVEFVKARNANARFILTVSPVPLIATYENRSVLVSTTYSKSVLRVAAEELAAGSPDVAYFPSYEIITGHFNRGRYFAPDLRSITAAGVAHVFGLFLKHYALATEESSQRSADSKSAENESAKLIMDLQDVVKVMCDEEALDPDAGA